MINLISICPACKQKHEYDAPPVENMTEGQPSHYCVCWTCGHLYIHNFEEPSRNMNAADKTWLNEKLERVAIVKERQALIIERLVG